jgi:hypothetical protein
VYVYLFHPGREAITRGEPWQQVEVVVPVTGDPGAQATSAAARFAAGDPRASGRICGGSPGR